jgi:succinyl-CoA synthetase alpha subunit
MLKQTGIQVNETSISTSDVHISLTIDRTALSPAVIASTSPGFEPSNSARLPFPYTKEKFEASDSIITAAATQLSLPTSAHGKLAGIVQALWQIFKQKEAFVLEVRANYSAEEGFEVRGARFGFDDAAFRSSGRQEKIHALRDVKEEVPEEVEAETDGIVYVKYALSIFPIKPLIPSP